MLEGTTGPYDSRPGALSGSQQYLTDVSSVDLVTYGNPTRSLAAGEEFDPTLMCQQQSKTEPFSQSQLSHSAIG